MSAWEMADTLLNKPEYFAFDEYGYLFMPYFKNRDVRKTQSSQLFHRTCTSRETNMM
jgi:hypothetical protein